MKLTPEQALGIKTLDCSLLLSAAAGSGKTAVLARRCAYIVCQSEGLGREPCGVENLLVVTFTKAAAQQMRDRIARQLHAELEIAEKAHDSATAARLRREMALLPRAAISTISSFCAGIVRRHFQAAGVDPNFSVLDEDQAYLLKRQAARVVLDNLYERGEEAFLDLIDLYADGYDDRLIGTLIGCHNLLTSVADPAAWRREALQQVEEAAGMPVAESCLGRQFLALLAEEMDVLVEWAQRLRVEAESFGLGGYAEHIRERMIAPARKWAAFAKAQDLEGLCQAFAGFDKGRLPNTPAGPGKEEVQDEINTWKRQVTQRDPSILLRFSEAEWIEGMKRVIAPTQQLLDLVEAFEVEYARSKDAIRAMDFADLERKSLHLLLNDPSRPDRLEPSDIALYYQRQFHHVLVDEFQDINQVQDHLLRLLSRESAPEAMRAAWRNNLFAVGDVKQSIYRFRLAEPAMFMARADLADAATAAGDGNLKRINLQTNFRSRGPLLEAINVVFHRLMSDKETLDIDYAQAHSLTPNHDYAAVPPGGFGGAPVELHVLEPQGSEAPQPREDDDDPEEEEPLVVVAAEEEAREADRIEREATVVAQRIETFRSEGRHVLNDHGEPEPFTYRHAAVLLRSRKFNSERFANVLRKMGVPCFSEIGTGFFGSLEVRDVLSLLHTLDNRRQDIPLAAVLRSPLVDLPDAEDVLARVRLMYRDRDIPFFEAVLRYVEYQDDAIAARLRYLLNQLEEWRRLAHRRPLAELIWQVYTDTGYLAYVSGLHDGEQRVANLLELHRRAGQFDSFQRQGLGAFMQFLKSLEDSGEVGQPPTLSEADDVVRVMSIHAAKGLEFPVVFLPDCGKAHNLRDTYGPILYDRQVKLALQAVHKEKQIRYPSLVHELARRRIRRASLAEELRVLYVAMTRAKEHLVCVGTATKDASADIERWRRNASTDPMPAAEVLKGRSYLEWLGQAAAGDAEHFDIRTIAAGDIDPEAALYSGRARIKPVPEPLVSLQPLDPAPEADDATRAALDRLTTPYRFSSVARLRASAGVTSLISEDVAELTKAHHFDKAHPFRGGEAARVTSTLQPPTFLDATRTPSAPDIGTATHIALRHLDFRAAHDEAAVQRQIDEMVQRHQLTPGLARHIDTAALAWLAGTELGQLLAEHHDRLLRELPLRVPAEASAVVPGWSGETDGPLDRVLLRGQVDIVIPLDTGLVLADYKTDRLNPKDPAGMDFLVAGLLERYRPQVAHYQRALKQVTNREIDRTYLVLLHPRRLERL